MKRYRDTYAVMKTAIEEERLDMARKLKQAGVAISIIVNTTELTIEEIERL